MTLFKRYLPIFGLILVTTFSFGQTAIVQSGITQVKLSNAFVNALTALKVVPGTVNPTELKEGVASFPVSGGAIDLQSAKGEIAHSGGLSLSKGGTTVTLQSFTIDTVAGSPVLTGLVSVNGTLVGRLPLFDLSLPSGLTLPLKPVAGVRLNLFSVGVSLSDAAAGALNSIFKTSAFAGGLKIGTASAFTIIDAN